MLKEKLSRFPNQDINILSGDKNVEDSDLLLWKSFKSGSESAFIFIYEHNFEMLYSYGRRLTNNEDVIKDAIQDLFIELRKNRENLGDTDSIKFYLFKCLKRRINKELNT